MGVGGTVLTLCPLGSESASRDDKEWDALVECSGCNFQHHWGSGSYYEEC